MIELWPFQKKLVRDVRAALRQYRAIGMVAPTGSGKTACSGYMALEVHKQVSHLSGSALYLVHRRELLTQTGRTLDNLGLKDAYGYIAAGKPAKPWVPMHIGSIPTVVRRLDQLDWLDPKVIFVDEGHHATAATWARVIKRWPKAFVIFLTATPMRNDDTGLGDMIDHLVLGPQISDLTPDYLAPVRTFAVPPTFNMTAMTLKAQSENQTGAVIARCVDNWQRIRPDGNTIFFCVDIDHSEAVARQLRDRGVRAEHVDYKTDTDRRDRIFRDLRSGHLQCVTNVKLFTEGTDWPECDTIVLARNTGSLVDYRQMNGRGMRRKHDGRGMTAIDTAGNIYMHGYPDDDIEWELEYGTDTKKQKAAAAANRVCEFCNYVYAKTEPVCPLCGAAPVRREVEEVDVEISEAKGDINPDRKKKKPTKRTLTAEILATGGDMNELRKLRRKYGYHARWPERMAEVYKYAFR